MHFSITLKHLFKAKFKFTKMTIFRDFNFLLPLFNEISSTIILFKTDSNILKMVFSVLFEHCPYGV